MNRRKFIITSAFAVAGAAYCTKEQVLSLSHSARLKQPKILKRFPFNKDLYVMANDILNVTIDDVAYAFPIQSAGKVSAAFLTEIDGEKYITVGDVSSVSGIKVNPNW